MLYDEKFFIKKLNPKIVINIRKVAKMLPGEKNGKLFFFDGAM